MSLFIQSSAAPLGTGGVSALDAAVDMLFISNGDTNVGQIAVAGQPQLQQVIYGPQVDPGIPATRLFQLVNTNFGVNPQNIDIIVVAGGIGFMLNDGSSIAGNGVTMSPGLTISGVTFNPTTSVVVIYDVTDNGGQGLCLKPQNSDDLNLATPAPVILYHELSHALRFALGTTLDTTETDCSDAAPEETAAETDENDMRDQLVTARGGVPDGSTRRDTNNHCGNPNGCQSGGDCCIVASVASGSPYSKEVQMLRRVRDQFLRRSSVGLDFFDRLHYDYYAFSPQVCRLMSGSPQTRQLVERCFVRPLVDCLQLVRDYALATCPAAELGARFLARVEGNPYLNSLGRAEIAEALDLLRGTPGAVVQERALGALVEQLARPSEYVRWALMEPLETYIQALIWRIDGCAASEIGERLGVAIDGWGARMPVTAAWNDLSNRALREELEFLKTALLKSPAARAEFARRLPASFWHDEARARLLANAGFSKECAA